MIDFSSYPKFTQFSNKKIMSIDFGSKVIGTALYIPNRDPFPYSFEKIIYQTDSLAISEINKLINDEAVEVIVFGVPYFLDGKESDNTKRIKFFGDSLKLSLSSGIEFYEQDETLTTQAAKDRMMNSPEYNFKVDVTKIDCLSAVIILEDFIRS